MIHIMNEKLLNGIPSSAFPDSIMRSLVTIRYKLVFVHSKIRTRFSGLPYTPRRLSLPTTLSMAL